MNIAKYALGLDFGTNSVRALIVDIPTATRSGRPSSSIRAAPPASCSIRRTPTGPPQPPAPLKGAPAPPAKKKPPLARQNPPIDPRHRRRGSLAPGGRKKNKNFSPRRRHRHRRRYHRLDPLPVDRGQAPLAASQGIQEESQRHGLAVEGPYRPRRGGGDHGPGRREHPEYLAKCGGTYSSEWFFSKILHCLRRRPRRSFAAA